MSDGRAVGLVGAFERDNFGDILFLERTSRYLHAAGIPEVAITPFRTSPPLFEGRPAITLSEADSVSALNAIWTVGGEVGAVPLYAAYRMLDGERRALGYDEASRWNRRATIRRESGGKVTDLAYLPRPSKFGSLRAAPYVINSAGVSGVEKLKGDMRLAAEAALREADFISVRDSHSARFLDALGVPYCLAPDLVHTLRLDNPGMWTDEARLNARQGGRVMFQMSEAMMQSHGVDSIVDAIARSELIREREVRLFAAGLAPSHDSIELYQALRGALLQRFPEMRVSISSAESPLEKVAELATSALVVGTSLHAMIVSMSFDVPHVGLLLEKVSKYASTWGDPMPTAVPISGLGAATERAFETETAFARSGIADRLADQAKKSIDGAIEVLGDTSEAATTRRAHARERSAAFVRSASLSPRVVATSVLRTIVRPLA